MKELKKEKKYGIKKEERKKTEEKGTEKEMY